MAATSTTTSTHFGAGQTWESQLICLFIIIGFVLLYGLGCHLYTISVGWHDDAEALNRLLTQPPAQNPNPKPSRR
ncbi:hypothetical protein DFH07DRAFT_970461 [Mycena maculata]|uniref:Uncharacterized protein n=1 Tax=Mycena maculata TaxID=230809 RepID=A0AAD7HT44_9AGAR|nr:hypothetical protein DFH07DRAFT_970461 [Mycena maculata]